MQKGNKEVLFFVHGLFGDITGWNKLNSHLLKEKYTFIFMDTRAHGKSGKSYNEKLSNCNSVIKDAIGILKKEKIKKVTLVGFSQGTVSSLLFSIMHPEYLKKQILLSANGSFGKTLFEKLLVALSVYPTAMLYFNPLTRKMLSSGIGKEKDFTNIKWVTDYNLNLIEIFSALKKMKIGNAYHFLKDISTILNSQDLQKVKTPTLLLHGDKDTCFFLKRARQLNEEIKSSKLVVLKNMNHHGWNNCPEQLCKEIKKYVDEDE